MPDCADVGRALREEEGVDVRGAVVRAVDERVQRGEEAVFVQRERRGRVSGFREGVPPE